VSKRKRERGGEVCFAAFFCAHHIAAVNVMVQKLYLNAKSVRSVNSWFHFLAFSPHHPDNAWRNPSKFKA
jgi:hypothetical protein